MSIADRTPKSTGCKFVVYENEEAVRPIADNVQGFRQEFSILNFTGDLIYYINPLGEFIEIPPANYQPRGYHEPHVNVSIRTSLGFLRNRPDYSKPKEAINRRLEIIIPKEALNLGQIFIPELGVVVTTLPYKSTSVNPASPEYQERLKSELLADLISDCKRSPITLYANDQGNNFKHVYMLYDNEIYGVSVSHYCDIGDQDRLTFIRHTQVGGDNAVTSDVQTCGFNRFRRDPTYVWEVGNYLFATDKRSLMERITAKKEEVPNVLTLEDHRKKLEAMEAKLSKRLDDELKLKNDEIAQQKREIHVLKGELEQAESARFSDKNAEIRVRELENDLEKTRLGYQQIAQEKISLESELKTAKLKLGKEVTAFFRDGIKIFAVIATAVLAIYKIRQALAAG